MQRHQGGYTLVEVTLAFIILNLIFAFSFFQAIKGVDEAAKFRGMAEQAQKLVNYVDRVRRSPTSVAVGSPVYPGGSPSTYTYLNLPAGSTTEEFRTAYASAFGVPARRLPPDSPFDTPYLITITPEISFVETTVAVEDVNIPGAEAFVAGGNTTFRFFPRINGSVRPNTQSARAAFQRNFVGEPVR